MWFKNLRCQTAKTVERLINSLTSKSKLQAWDKNPQVLEPQTSVGKSTCTSVRGLYPQARVKQVGTCLSPLILRWYKGILEQSRLALLAEQWTPGWTERSCLSEQWRGIKEGRLPPCWPHSGLQRNGHTHVHALTHMQTWIQTPQTQKNKKESSSPICMEDLGKWHQGRASHFLERRDKHHWRTREGIAATIVCMVFESLHRSFGPLLDECQGLIWLQKTSGKRLVSGFTPQDDNLPAFQLKVSPTTGIQIWVSFLWNVWDQKCFKF